MRRPVYFTSFNHQEKAIFVFGQFLEGLSCHLFEGRLLGRIAIQVVIHLFLTEEGPHFAIVVSAHTGQIVAIDAVTPRPKVSLAFFVQKRDATTDHNVYIVVDDLRRNPIIAFSAVTMCGAVCRSGMCELASDNQTGSLVLYQPHGLQQSDHRLISARGIYGENVIARISRRVGSDVTCTARMSGHITGGRRCRIADWGVGREGPNRTTEIRVDGQVLPIGIFVPLVPASRGHGRNRRSIGDQEDQVFDRLHIGRINRARTSAQGHRNEQQERRCCLSHLIKRIIG